MTKLILLFTSHALNSTISNNGKIKINIRYIDCKIFHLNSDFYHEYTALKEDNQVDLNRRPYYCSSKRKREHARLSRTDFRGPSK